MIIGNPYNFSIFIKTIKEWNKEDGIFYNGILLFCIDGYIFPKKEILSATLSYEIPKIKNDLKNICVNKDIYNMSKYKAFKEMYNRRYPKNFDIEEDYSFEISPSIFLDNDYIIFAVSDGKNVRIMGTHTKYIIKESKHIFKNKDIKETFITINDLNKIITQLKIY